MKLGMDEVFKVPYKCCRFSARSAQGRIQGGAKIGHGEYPSSKNFFRPEGYSNKPNAKQWSKTSGKKCCYFWFYSEVKFVLRLLDLVIWVYFNAISIDFYSVKSFICIKEGYSNKLNA